MSKLVLPALTLLAATLSAAPTEPTAHGQAYGGGLAPVPGTSIAPDLHVLLQSCASRT